LNISDELFALFLGPAWCPVNGDDNLVKLNPARYTCLNFDDSHWSESVRVMIAISIDWQVELHWTFLFMFSRWIARRRNSSVEARAYKHYSCGKIC
jgi:hypothetical protein